MSSQLQSLKLGSQGTTSIRAVLDFPRNEITGTDTVDLTGAAAVEPAISLRNPGGTKIDLVDLTDEYEFSSSVRKSSKLEAQRIVPYRDVCPDAVLLRLRRLDSQRLYVLDQTDTGTVNRPSKRYGILNSFGKTFSIHISSLPSCDCDESKVSSPCKHILFVLAKVSNHNARNNVR